MRNKPVQTLGIAASLLTAAAACPFWAAAQTSIGEINAATSAGDALNNAPTGGGGAASLALQRARNLQSPATQAFGAPGQFGASIPAQAPAPGTESTGALNPDFNPAPPSFEPLTPIFTGAGTAGEAGGPRISVITGARVFDAVTKVMIDDAQERLVPESERSRYFDDGTHGDLLANDGKYTLVEETSDYLAQGHQRIKELLIKSLTTANAMDPIQFYGYSLLSTDNVSSVSRDSAWKLVPSPGGVGSTIALTPIDRPLEVPNLRDKEAQKDERVDYWADHFLQEFRKNKDSVTSEFYPVYVPMPPVPPAVAPPAGFQPFMAAPPPAAGIDGGGGIPGIDGPIAGAGF